MKFLYPPRIAKNGRSGFSKTFSKYFNSFSIKNPATFFSEDTPTIELKKTKNSSELFSVKSILTFKKT